MNDSHNHEDRMRGSVQSQEEQLAKNIVEFELVCKTASDIGMYCSRLPDCSMNQDIASRFYTIICILLLELRRIVKRDPHRPLALGQQAFQLLDIVSPTILLRSLLEAFLHFHYMCLEDVTEQVKRMRSIYWDWYGHHSRLRLANRPMVTEGAEEHKALWTAQKEELERQLSTCEPWMMLTSKVRNDLIFHPKRPTIQTQKEIAETAGIHKWFFESIYGLASAYSHCGPIPLSHIYTGAFDREGSLNILDVTATHGTVIGCLSIKGMIELFPDARVKEHALVRDLTAHWVFVAKNWGRFLENFSSKRPNSAPAPRSLQ